MAASARWNTLGLVAGMVAISLNQRPTLVAVGALTAQLRADTGLSAAAVSLLTTLPLLCFGVVAGLAAPISRRWGMDRTVVVALAVLLAGIAIRLVPSVAALFIGLRSPGSARREQRDAAKRHQARLSDEGRIDDGVCTRCASMGEPPLRPPPASRSAKRCIRIGVSHWRPGACSPSRLFCCGCPASSREPAEPLRQPAGCECGDHRWRGPWRRTWPCGR